MNNSTLPGCAALLLCLTVATPTLAQDESEPSSAEKETPRPKMNLSVAPPPEPVQRTDYVHEGFYLRVNVGGGFLSTTLQDKVADASETSTTFSLGADLLVGGSPSPGFTFGGGVLSDIGFTSDFGSGSGGPVLQFLVGPFFDAFPNNKGGWHLGTMLGGVGAGIAESRSTPLFGGGAAAWAGYDMWVAPDWSSGFKLRATGSHVVATDAAATNFSLVLLISILNH